MPETPEQTTIVWTEIDDIEEAEYNPRKMRPSSFAKLKASIERWGLVDPLIVNKTNGRLVGGHQRLRAARDLGHEKVPVVYVELDDDEEKALNIALNNAELAGEWDTPKLAQLLADLKGTDVAALTGFDQHQAAQFIEKLKDVAAPVYPLTPKMLEHYDYVVILTAHETDWMNLKAIFGLETEASYKKRKIGTGRVVTFERFLEVLEEQKQLPGRPQATPREASQDG